MPKKAQCNDDIPLPSGWQMCRDIDGKIFFIDHNNQETSWIDPRDRITKPLDFSQCRGDELPYGWEQAYDNQVGIYYTNHILKCNQLEDPRQQHLREEQERMLKEYLVHAQQDVENKKEICSVKRERLLIAREEVQHLNETLANWKCSRTSLHSVSSGASNKYDPDLLKSEVDLARKRVQRLKQEIAEIQTQMKYKEMGVETLTQVEQKLLTGEKADSCVYTMEDAHDIIHQIRTNYKSLTKAEEEKRKLMSDVAALKDEMWAHSRMRSGVGSSPDLSLLSIPRDCLSTASCASQTDLSGEQHGNKWGEVARLRLQYNEATKQVSALQQQLAGVEDQIRPGQSDSDKDRLLLLEEKEQLLRELRSVNGRSEEDMSSVRARIQQLQLDLREAMQLSNRQIAERIKLNETKADILKKLEKATKLTSYLETQLKSLSVSTLSISSGSSRGSVGSLASSKSSLSSLNFIDIYTQPSLPDVDLPDLHRRVEKLLQGVSGGNDPGSNQYLATIVESPQIGSSQSPQSSHSSVISGASPYDVGPPPTYKQHIDKQRVNQSSSHPNVYASSVSMSNSNQYHMSSSHPNLTMSQPSLSVNPNIIAMTEEYANTAGVALLQQGQHPGPAQRPVSRHGISTERSHELDLVPQGIPAEHFCVQPPPPYPGAQNRDPYSNTTALSIHSQPQVTQSHPHLTHSDSSAQKSNFSMEQTPTVAQKTVSPHPHLPKGSHTQALAPVAQQPHVEGPLPPLSPLSESSSGKSGAGARSVSAGVSDESVAGDSGVFEASAKRSVQLDGDFEMNLECAQIQIKLRYEVEECSLSVTVEQARNLAALQPPQHCQICIKAALLPSNQNAAFQTCTSGNAMNPQFRETFRLAVPENRLASKTLQLHVWCISPGLGEELLGSAQVSLASFDYKTVSTAWYNVLSFRFMQSEQPQSRETPKVPESTKSPQSADSSQEQRLKPAALESALFKHNVPPGGASSSLKEESSDESTIISSQTSTLTRNQGPEAMAGHGSFYEDDAAESSGEEEVEFEFGGYDDSDCNFSPEGTVRFISVDKETNTDVALSVDVRRNKGQGQTQRGHIRRSQTFTPNVFRQSDDSIRSTLNRSDSDSSVRNRKGPFQRNAVERKSVRHRRSMLALPKIQTLSLAQHENKQNRTSIDLELDLQASQAKLKQLGEEVERLKLIKHRFEVAKIEGTNEPPKWFTENENLQHFLLDADRLKTKGDSGGAEMKTTAEQRAEHLLRKAKREVHKLRKSQNAKEQHKFREKMVQITSMTAQVPIIPAESDSDNEESTFKQGHTRVKQRSKVAKRISDADIESKPVSNANSPAKEDNSPTASSENG